MKTTVVIMANGAEPLDRTMECFGEAKPEEFDALMLIASPGFEGDLPALTVFDSISIDKEYAEGMNIAREHCLKNGTNLLILRAGVTFTLADVLDMVKNEDPRMEMGSILDPLNGNMEFTSVAKSAIPLPSFDKGERKAGVDETWWADGPIMFVSYRLLSDVGMFDVAVGENYTLIDYSIRARWHGYSVYLNHDCACRFVNEKPFNIVFMDRVKERFSICRSNMIRKYGGDILRTLQ